MMDQRKFNEYDRDAFELENQKIGELESHLDREIDSFMSSGKKKRLRLPGNALLYIGTALLILLFAVCFFPESFTKIDPHGLERSQFVFIDGKLNMFAPPYGPGSNWPWGTDLLGRDIKSLIIYGAGMTIFSAVFITLIRTGIALVISIFAAYGFRLAKDGIRIFSAFFSAFPLTMVVLLVISSGWKLGPTLTDGGYAVGLPVILTAAFLGWGRLAGLLTEKTSEILKMDFIEGERAIGKSKWKIALENLVPHLLPQLVVLAFLEVSGVLLLLCQIGFFSILINGGFTNGDGEFIPPVGMDWASLLSVAPRFIIGGKYWLVLFPAAAFAYSIFAFNLAGEGIGVALDRSGSKIISYLRNTPAVFSPLRYIYQLRHFKEYRKTVLRKSAVVTLVLVLLLWPAAKGNVQINGAELRNETKWLCQDSFKGRMTGSGLNKEVSAHLQESMEKSGLETFADGFTQVYPVEAFKYAEKAEISVSNDLVKEKKLIHRQDFQVTSPISIKGDFKVRNLANLSLEAARATGYEDPTIKDEFVLVDVRNLPPWNFSMMLNTFNDIVKPKGLIYITDDSSDGVPEKNSMDRMKGKEYPIPNIRLTAEAGEELKRLNEFSIHVDISGAKTENSEGYNVIGKIPGTGKDTVIVGVSYDGPGDDKDTRFPSAGRAAAAASLEQIYKALAEKKGTYEKTILFALWDGSYARDRGSIKFIEAYGEREERIKFPPKLSEDTASGKSEKVPNVLYIHLGSLGRGERNTLRLDTSGCLPRDEFSMSFIRQLRGSQLKNRPKLVDGVMVTNEKLDFQLKNVNVIQLSETDEKITRTPRDTFEDLDESSIENTANYLANELYRFCRSGKGGRP